MPAKVSQVFADIFYDKMAQKKPPTRVSGLGECADGLFPPRSEGFDMVLFAT